MLKRQHRFILPDNNGVLNITLSAPAIHKISRYEIMPGKEGLQSIWHFRFIVRKGKDDVNFEFLILIFALACGVENFEQRWKAVETLLEERFGKVPDMEGVLFLVGMNELGQPPKRNKFTKEQKQDLMHIAVCTLLSQLGYYEFQGRDDEDWPHFVLIRKPEVDDMQAQEQMLKECVVNYFGL